MKKHSISKKSIISWILVFCMILGMMPVSALAAEGEVTTYPIFTPDKRTKKPHTFAYFTSVHVNDANSAVVSVDATDPMKAIVYLNSVPTSEEDIPKAEYTTDGPRKDSLVITDTVTVDDGEAVQTIHAYYNDNNQTTWTITYKGMCNDETTDHTWGDGVVKTEATCLPGEESFTCTKCKAEKIKQIAPVKDHAWDEGTPVEGTQSYWDETAGETVFTCPDCSTTEVRSTPFPLIENPEFITGAYYLDSEGSKVELTFEKRDSSVKIYEWVKFYNPIFTFNVPEGTETIYVECTTDVWQVASHYWAVAFNENDTPADKYDDNGNNYYTWEVTEGVIAMSVEPFVGGAYAAAVDAESSWRICYIGIESTHVWDEGTVTTEPTCTTEGVKTFKCTYELCTDDEEAVKTEAIPVLDHTYDKEVADEKYLASKADFSNAATYYKSCACGEKGSETFTSGEALGVAIADSVKKEIANYKKADDYREEQKAELAAIIEAANKAIDAATSEEEIKKAVEEAKATMDKVKTDAQLKTEEEANKPGEETNKPEETQQLTAPVKVKASNVAKSGKIKVTWSKVEGAAKYKVYRATKKNGKYKLVKTVTGTSYTDSSTKVGKSFYFKVKAVSNDQNVTASTFSKAVKGTVDLKMPVVTAKSKTKKQVKLTWKKVSSAKKYEIYRATKKNGKYKKIATTTKLSYTNKKLKSGKTYYYKVKAVAKKKAANSALSKVDKCKIK